MNKLATAMLTSLKQQSVVMENIQEGVDAVKNEVAEASRSGRDGKKPKGTASSLAALSS